MLGNCAWVLFIFLSLNKQKEKKQAMFSYLAVSRGRSFWAGGLKTRKKEFSGFYCCLFSIANYQRLSFYYILTLVKFAIIRISYCDLHGSEFNLRENKIAFCNGNMIFSTLKQKETIHAVSKF